MNSLPFYLFAVARGPLMDQMEKMEREIIILARIPSAKPIYCHNVYLHFCILQTNPFQLVVSGNDGGCRSAYSSWSDARTLYTINFRNDSIRRSIITKLLRYVRIRTDKVCFHVSAYLVLRCSLRPPFLTPRKQQRSDFETRVSLRFGDNCSEGEGMRVESTSKIESLRCKVTAPVLVRSSRRS